MERLIQVLVDGVANGAIYASLALAIVLAYRATGVPNLAQGDMAMVSTFAAWSLTGTGWPVGVVLAVVVAGSFAGGYLIERLVVRWVEQASELTIFIVMLGILYLLHAFAGWRWGFDVKTVPSMFSTSTVSVLGVPVSWQSIGIIVTVLVMMGLIYALFRWTALGLALRAAAQNPTSAHLSGINVGRMLGVGWGLAASIGAVAGIIVAPRVGLDPNLMAGILIYAVAAAVVGGLDSPGGAVVGGLLIGVAEALVVSYVDIIGTRLSFLVALAVISASLLLRPNGLFGRQLTTRA